MVGMKSTVRRAESTRYAAEREIGPFLRLIADQRVEGPKDKLGARFEKRAWTFLEGGQYEEALAACDRAIELEPGSVWAHADRGLTLWMLGRFAEAVASCDRAIELRPECAPAHAVRGSALYRLRRFEEALAACDHTIKLAPDFAVGHGERGRALFALGRGDEALGALDRAVELKPDFSDWHGTRGAQLLRVGRIEEALAAFDRAIELQPDFAELLGLRGMALYRLDRYAEAIAAFDHAIELRPDIAAPWQVIRSRALLKVGRYSEAVAALDRAIELKPETAQRGDIIALQELLRASEQNERFDESNKPSYTVEGRADRQTAADLPPGIMSYAEDLKSFAAKNGFETVSDLQKFIDDRKAAHSETTQRETTSRSATDAPRLKWEKDAKSDEDPAHFAARAYATEAKANKLHRGVIYDEDRVLYTKLNSWLRSNAMPEGIDIPTKREWITRQIEAGRAKPAPFGQRPNTEEERLYETLRKRQSRPSPTSVQKSARHILT